MIRVGLIGTGYAAKLRAENIETSDRAKLVIVAGHQPEKTQQFCQTFQVEQAPSWQDLTQRADLDLVIVSTINRDHGTIARSALQAGKHVVVEYPLCLDVTEAQTLVQLARGQNRMLHVEHIELLSGIHETIHQLLPQIGTPFYGRYGSVNPQRPAPAKWTYQAELFGFPLMGALSRLQRLIHLFGPVATVNCQTRYWSHQGFALPTWTGFSTPYAGCLCHAQLLFSSGLLVDLTYGKGEVLWQDCRAFEIHGSQGALLLEGETGELVFADRREPVQTGSRRGLFAKDTQWVIDHLTQGVALYLQPEESVYALRVAEAARQSAESGQVVKVT